MDGFEVGVIASMVALILMNASILVRVGRIRRKEKKQRENNEKILDCLEAIGDNLESINKQYQSIFTGIDLLIKKDTILEKMNGPRKRKIGEDIAKPKSPMSANEFADELKQVIKGHFGDSAPEVHMVNLSNDQPGVHQINDFNDLPDFVKDPILNAVGISTGEEKKITTEELTEMFGPRIPTAAVEFLFSPETAGMTIKEVRDRLKSMRDDMVGGFQSPTIN